MTESTSLYTRLVNTTAVEQHKTVKISIILYIVDMEDESTFIQVVGRSDEAAPHPFRLEELPLEDAVRERLNSCKELIILVVGRYQMGKSTLINSLFFQEGGNYIEHATEGSLSRCTDDVEPYVLEGENVSYKIYDSPGLQDGSRNDIKYLRMIKRKCPRIHLIIYCTKMDEPVRPEEVATMRNLTLTFGETLWDNVVIALTFANQVQPANPGINEAQYFSEIFTRKREVLNEHFCLVPIERERVDNLMRRVYPTGSARVLKLPGKENDWRVDFWLGCLAACQPEAKGALLKLAWKNREFLMKVAGVSVSTTSGTVGMALGVGSMLAGGALAATGFLAPVGVPLIAAGAIATLLGAAATFSSATSIKSVTQEHKDLYKGKDN